MEPFLLVHLPGLDGTGVMSEPLAERVPAPWKSQIVRYPGDELLGYDDLLCRIRGELPTSRPFVLLGESFAGPLAIRLAAEQPPGLRGVILCATFATTSAPWLPRWSHRWVRPSTVLAWQVGGRWAARLRGRCPPELRVLFQRARRLVRYDVIAARVREAVTVDVTADLERIQVPMLYLAARHDHVVPQTCLKRILHHRPDMEVAWLEASHWILQVHVDQALCAMRPFLDRCLAMRPQKACG